LSHLASMTNGKVASDSVNHPPTKSLPGPLYDYEELPPGWVKAIDCRFNRFFYVDSLAEPPVSIWVHPFRHPQFLRQAVGIEPHEIPDEADLQFHMTSFIDEESLSNERRSFLGRIKKKIRANKEIRAAANARILQKRIRAKQIIYLEARKALMAFRESCGRDVHEKSSVRFIPPHECDFGGPGYKEENAQSFGHKIAGALIRGFQD